MSKIYFLSFFACAIIMVDASEEKNVAPALPDWTVVQKELEKDYQGYLNKCLEAYKTTDINMDELVTMSTLMTGAWHNRWNIETTRDMVGDHFIHVAIDKVDLPTVEWIYNNAKCSGGVAVNNGKESPLDLCLRQLEPPCNFKKGIKYKILYATIQHIGKVCNDPYKNVCLRTVLTSELYHQQNRGELVLPLEVICCLIPQAQLAQEQLFLSNTYASIQAKCGNAFTHILAAEGDSDALFKWIQQGRVSFVKNKGECTPLDIALAKFRQFTQNVALIEQDKTTFEKRKCCLFMLLNYLKIKSGQPAQAHFDQCCSKHSVS